MTNDVNAFCIRRRLQPFRRESDAIIASSFPWALSQSDYSFSDLLQQVIMALVYKERTMRYARMRLMKTLR
jgi:hypothetical protein